MEPLRIAHILPWSNVGGTELATIRIAMLVGGGAFEHVAYCLPGAHGCRALFEAGGFETAAFDAVEPSYRSPGTWWRASRALARDLRRRRIGLMHCADVLAAHYVAAAGRMAGIPVLCHVRNRFESIGRRDRTFLMPVHRFAFVSRDTWRRFAYRVPERRGSVIYDGIATPEIPPDAGSGVRKEFGLPSDARLVGMVARIARQKDHETLIRAAAWLGNDIPDLRFLVIGDQSGAAEYREHYAKLRQMIAGFGLEDRFVFTGHRNDVNWLIASLDIFALATHHEGLPLVILEAMAMGKPVIATAVDGIPEIVEDGVTGLLHRHGDDRQLAEQIGELARDRGKAARLGEAGRRLVASRFSTQQFAKHVGELYRTMTGARR